MKVIAILYVGLLVILVFVIFLITRSPGDTISESFKDRFDKIRDKFTFEQKILLSPSTAPRFVVSFSTIPARIDQSLRHVSEQMSLQTVQPAAIYACIPYYSKRFKDPYVLPSKIPSNITVIRGEDYGPATKLIGCISAENDPEVIVITVDDDMLYEADLLQNLVSTAIAFPDACVGNNALTIDGQGGSSKTEFRTDPYIYALEGFGGVATRLKFVDKARIIKMAGLSSCFLSDDLVLSRSAVMSGASLICWKRNSVKRSVIDSIAPLRLETKENNRELIYQKCQISLLKFEFTTKYLWSKSYFLMADNMNRSGFDVGFDNELNVDEFFDGCTICIQGRFDKLIKKLPQIRARFTLICCDCDDSLSPLGVSDIIDNPKLISIYSTNLDLPYSHPKIHYIPLGIDYHTDYYQSRNTQSMSIHPLKQDQMLSSLADSALVLAKRADLIYCNAHILISHPERTIMYNELKDNPLLVFEGERTGAQEFWRKASQFSFVISPRGAGIDCHRTWEALILGCIVITKTSSIDPVYHDLPVVIVKSWDEITPDNIKAWKNWAMTGVFNMRKLTFAYWNDLINPVTRAP